jgi:hypothetical protein
MACGWVTVAIILHNLIINIEGVRSAGQFANIHTTIEEDEDTGMDQTIHYEVLPDGEVKWERLIDALMAWREMRDEQLNLN